MKWIIILIFLFFSCVGVFAQSVNLEQARELALASSRSLLRYEMSIRSSVLDERNQLYSMLPQVSAEYRASMYYLRDWDFINPIETFSSGAAFSITQIIFQGGKSFLQKAISSIATESVRKDAKAEYFNVLDMIDNVYYAVLEAKAALEAEESSLQAALLGLTIAEIRQQSGMINQGDFLKALAEKEARENSRNQARRNLALNMTRFKTLTGINENVELEYIDFSSYDDTILNLAGISDEDADSLYEKLWDILIRDNPSLAKAALNNQRAEKSYTLSRRDFAPTISATIFSTDVNFLYPDRFNSSNHGGVTIRGSIPIDFWVLSNRMEKSRIARDSAVIDYENSVSSLELELGNALTNAFTQAGSVLSLRRSLEYTEKHFEFVMERYRLGQSSVSDLNEATSLFISSRNNLNRASYSFLQSLSRLRSMCALDDEDRLLEILIM